jgi:hypothetical protein
VTGVHLTFPIEANFTKVGRTFKSVVNIAPTAYVSACRVDVFGSLEFVQERELNVNRYTDVPVSDEFIEYTRTHVVELNASHPSIAGDLLFVTRNEYWTYGKGCTLFEIGFRMRIPMVHFIGARPGIYAFLDGWTSYVAIAAPLFILVRRVLGAMFRSGFVPAQETLEAELNPEKIAKFNR